MKGVRQSLWLVVLAIFGLHVLLDMIVTILPVIVVTVLVIGIATLLIHRRTFL